MAPASVSTAAPPLWRAPVARTSFHLSYQRFTSISSVGQVRKFLLVHSLLGQIPVFGQKAEKHRFCSQHFFTMFDPFPCPVSTFHPPSVCPSLVGAFVLASAEATFFPSSRQRWGLTGKTCYAKLGETTVGFQPPVETEVTVWASPEMGYCTK